MGNNLIISDHTRLWSKKNNILIGDWCNPNYKKNFLKKEKYVTINYHWKKKEKIRKDLIYLNKLYEFLLNELTIKLNNYHKIKFSKRCWEVILSKWLWFYLVFYFDRWEQIDKLTNQKKLSTKLINFEEEKFIAFDSQDYCTNITKTADWNHHAFSKIICFKKKIQFKFLTKHKINPKKNKTKKLIISRLKIFIIKVVSLITSKKFYCISIFNGRLSNIIFSLFFQQFNSRITFLKKYKNYNLDLEERKKNLFITKNNVTKFEKFILHNIYKNLPKSYFENFKSINELIKTLNLPISPKVIITAYEHHFNDVFKIYVANKIMNKTKYYIVQHGGSYGSADLFPTEHFDIKLSDKFFSWGWKEKNKKINKFFCNRNFFLNEKIKKDKTAKGIIIPYIESTLYLNNVASGRPRTSIDIKLYSNILNNFYRNLDFKIKKDSFFKGLKIQSLHKFVENFLKNNNKNIKFIKSDVPTYKFLNKFKLNVETLNSTGYLESLQLNLPTIIIFNKNFCDIRQNTLVDFEDLKKANILFNDPCKAANFVNQNYDRLEDWWSSMRLQKIRKKFCDKYVRKCNTPFKSFKYILQSC